MNLAHSYLCLRSIDPETGGPVLPDTWEIEPNDGGWYVLRHPGLTVAAYRGNASGSTGLWALFGPRAWLESVAAVEPACMPMREAWARRGEADVRLWLRRWRT